MAFCKPLVSCLLGSPFGGAGTAAAVTERATCQRFYTAHAKGPLAPGPLRPPLEGTSPKGGGETWLSLRESWHGAAVTERASCQPHRPLPWLSPWRARPPRSLILFWLPPTKVKAVGLCPFSPAGSVKR